MRPSSDRYLVKSRTKNYDSLLLKKGMILTPSSGRNLGPVTYVGDYLARFAMTDIMRIVPNSETEGLYLLAFLLTPTAQNLIKRGRSGTTVDHLAPDEMLGIDVPWHSDEAWRDTIVSEMRDAEREIDEGRRGLDSAIEDLHRRVGLPSSLPEGKHLSRLAGEAFEVSSQRVGLRLDAASHDPSALACAAALRAKGGVPLPKLARPVTLPRYIRYYVDPPHGRPVLSGRQMMQLRPVNLRQISDRSFKNPGDFVLKTGTTIFTCDGRAEEGLGEPAYVLPNWEGWMASEHVMRLVAEDGIGHGYLYLSIVSP
jgi:hypothetical protein